MATCFVLQSETTDMFIQGDTSVTEEVLYFPIVLGVSGLLPAVNSKYIHVKVHSGVMYRWGGKQKICWEHNGISLFSINCIKLCHVTQQPEVWLPTTDSFSVQQALKINTVAYFTFR